MSARRKTELAHVCTGQGKQPRLVIIAPLFYFFLAMMTIIFSSRSISSGGFFSTVTPSRFILPFLVYSAAILLPSSFSGIAGLLRALLAEPEAILLDEPFSRLDQELRSAIRTFVFDQIKRLNIPALLVTHDPEDASGEQNLHLAGRKSHA